PPGDDTTLEPPPPLGDGDNSPCSSPSPPKSSTPGQNRFRGVPRSVDGAGSAHRRDARAGDADQRADGPAHRRAPHPERMRGPPHTEPGTGTSALVRRGVLLLGVMLELLALLLETVHQIRQTGTD